MSVHRYAVPASDGRVLRFGTAQGSGNLDFFLEANEAVEIAEETYLTLAAGGDYQLGADGSLTPLARPEPPIERLRLRAEQEIDQQAARARMRWITAGDGQDLEYILTRDEALRAAAAGRTTPSPDYPMLSADYEAQRRAGIETTFGRVIDDALTAAMRTTDKLAIIKQVRRAAKLRVRSVGSKAEIDAIMAALKWPNTGG